MSFFQEEEEEEEKKKTPRGSLPRRSSRWGFCLFPSRTSEMMKVALCARVRSFQKIMRDCLVLEKMNRKSVSQVSLGPSRV